MARKGRLTELLVAQIQQQLSGEQISVNSPKLFYSDNDKSKLIGEVDIVLEGSFGSTNVQIGIECRDRPAEGPQGVPFISLVLGKREVLGILKMIAVSTTGFTSDAVKLAQKHSIDILVISNEDSVEIKPFFKSVIFVYTNRKWKVTGPISISIKSDSEKPTIMSKIKFGDRIFIDTNDRAVNLLEVMYDLLFKSSDDNTLKRSFTYESEDIDYRIIDNSKACKIGNMRVPVSIDVTQDRYKMILNVCHNSEGKIISTAGTCEAIIGGEKIIIISTITEDKGQRNFCVSGFYKDMKPYKLEGEFKLHIGK